MAVKNPFTPMFGVTPPFMAGRTSLMREITQAFDNGYGDPNLSSVLIGPRGSGKTALLTLLSEEASSRGWVCARTTAADGMLEDIIEQASMAASEFLEAEGSRRLKGVSVGGAIGVEWDNDLPRQGNWRTRMTRLLEQLDDKGVGLLITVDEVRASVDELRRLVIAYQHFVTERRNVALLMAGLPHNAYDLMERKDVSFLRRARQHRLERLSDAAVRDALRLTVSEAGRSIDDDALDEAVRASAGFPYMMQLVGYRMWAENPLAPTISAADARRGILSAREEMERGILLNTCRELSDGDIRFLMAMTQDDGDSSLADIAARLGVASNYASQYKRRLLDQGIIGERGRGYVGFDLPMLKDYLIATGGRV